MKMTWAEAVDLLDKLEVHPKVEWAPEDLKALHGVQEHARKQNPEEHVTLKELTAMHEERRPTFRFVSSVPWKWHPEGTDDDTQYLKENLSDYDPNEDHICGMCSAEVPGRFLFCSEECRDKLDEEMEKEK